MTTDPAWGSTAPLPRPASPALPPRRAFATIVATVLGLALLFSFKTPDAPSPSSLPGAVAVGTPAPTVSSGAAPRGTARPGTAGSPSPAPASSAPPPGGRRQVDGDVVSTQFGDTQVRVIVSGGRIVDIQALQLPFDRSRSAEISQFVEPILRNEALQAQSAQIDTVSGATYTSDAYRQSLQSALDRARG